MANITRFDPLSFDEPFENLIRNAFWRPLALESSKRMQIKLDVEEDDKQFTVHADMPGVSKENIKVAVDGNQVSISAHVSTATEKKDNGNFVHRERYEGDMYRSFTLSQTVDKDKAQANYRDGVLELVLPKRTDGGQRELTIQ
ncbi:Hsp20/alpha crystallin family protein [Pandoraea communis]|uniref:18 kDa heat shock protein n=1 Tax=Pandoraea communis TaxID=2508297 RepID=A0A5E4UUB4_9BURK|nr:Hsp20/alpha crystallin family protein [Pandoraea communis]MDM8358036.1 Hsp20/alpha crystallin family protein [Pandoraea communis]VVE03143.1 18 kDa heat shock protein [Pandoraea communis]